FAHLCLPVNGRLARTEIAALDRVLKQPENAIAVVLIIFRCVDSALGSNGMGATRRILITKTLHPITKFAEGGRSRSPGQSRADHNDLKFATSIWANQTRMVVVVSHLLLVRTGRIFTIGF